jgi:hypothetical protein
VPEAVVVVRPAPGEEVAVVVREAVVREAAS